MSDRTPSAIGPMALPPRPYRRPEDPWSEFLSWPGSTSLVTLLSAALLLAGLWGVLAPALADEAMAAPRWQVLGTLSAYLAALLAGVWAMCRARAGNPDAIASAVVGACFAVGFGVVLQLIAPSQPGFALGAGLAGWLGLAALGAGFTRAVGGAAWGAPGFGLLLLLGWSTLWPLVLSTVVVAEASRMPTAGRDAGGTDVAVMAWWTMGWLALCVLFTAGLAVARRTEPVEAPDRPFLQRRAMRWVLALVAGLTAVIALLVQAHIAGLDVAATDAMPPLILLCLLGAELAARSGSGPVRDVLAAAAPAVLAALLHLGGCGPDLESQFRGEGWAPDLVGLAGTAPGAQVLAAAVGALLAWRRRSPGLAWGSGLALLAGLVVWPVDRPLLAEGGIVACAVAGWAAARAGLPGLAVAAVAGVMLLAPATVVADAVLRGSDLRFCLGLAGASALLLAAGAFRPVWVGTGWARAAAWFLGACAAAVAAHLVHGRSPWPLPGGTAGEIAALACVLGLPLLCGWRRRDGAIAGAALPAGVVLGWPALLWLLPARAAWLAVWAAFALLGGGVAMAVRRARRERASAAPPPA